MWPLKNPMQNFWAIKIYSRNYAARICGNQHQSSNCFEYPKRSLLKIIMKLPTKILAKIFQPKKSPNQKFQTPKFLQSSLSIEIWSTPLGFQRSAPVQGFLWTTLQVVADPDLQIRWGKGYPDPEIGRGPGLKWYIQNWIHHHYWERPGLQELRLQWYYGAISKYAKIRLPPIIKSILCLRQNTSPLIHFLPAKMIHVNF